MFVISFEPRGFNVQGADSVRLSMFPGSRRRRRVRRVCIVGPLGLADCPTQARYCSPGRVGPVAATSNCYSNKSDPTDRGLMKSPANGEVGASSSDSGSAGPARALRRCAPMALALVAWRTLCGRRPLAAARVGGGGSTITLVLYRDHRHLEVTMRYAYDNTHDTYCHCSPFSRADAYGTIGIASSRTTHVIH